MTTTTKKTLYHSELTKRGEAAIKILGEVTNSKYEGKPPYVFIELDGAERTYNIENAHIEGKLILRSKGEVLRIKATGSRDEADIEILSGGDSAVLTANDRITGQAPKVAPPSQPDKDWPEARPAPTVGSTSSNGSVRTLDTVATGFYAALGKADELVTQFFSDAQRESWSAYEAADLVLRVAAGLSIETNKTSK